MATQDASAARIGDHTPWSPLQTHRMLERMSIVLCGVDDTEAGTTVMAAAKAAAERAGAPLLLTYVSNSLWGANIPAFHADGDATARVVEHGPPAQRILAVADGHDAELIVIGTRAK